MIEKLNEIKGELSELATMLNKFTSEAVQLRLLEIIFSEETPNAATVRRPTARRPRSGARKPLVDEKMEQGSAPEKRKRGGSGTGSNATLNELAQGDFFDKPRTINDIVEHCKHNLARTFKANEFSGKLGRMVRNKELTRKKNADGQYEYERP
jgi:hypothetical protein